VKSLRELLDEFPPELQKQAREFVESLVARGNKKQGGTLRQDWAGALKDYREKFTALDLEAKASEWRGD